MKKAPAAAAHPWSSATLLAKAQRYGEMMSTHSSDEWEFALASTFVLEFVARAALAHVSPVLLADAKDWNNSYFALGFEPKASKFTPKSTDISTVLNRLAEINPSFTPEMLGHAVRHMVRRNEELHSGGTPFDGLGTSGWLAEFYDICSVLLGTMGEDLELVFGPEAAATAKVLIEAAHDETAKSVGKLISAHKTIWEGKDSEERKTLAGQAALWSMKTEGHRVKCPSCSSRALVTGSAIAAPKKTMAGDIITEKQTYLPSKFECVACGLKISGFSQLSACGLGDSYTATSEYDAAQYYASEPEDFYEPDFNEY